MHELCVDPHNLLTLITDLLKARVNNLIQEYNRTSYSPIPHHQRKGNGGIGESSSYISSNVMGGVENYSFIEFIFYHLLVDHEYVYNP